MQYRRDCIYLIIYMNWLSNEIIEKFAVKAVNLIIFGCGGGGSSGDDRFISLNRRIRSIISVTKTTRTTNISQRNRMMYFFNPSSLIVMK